MDILVYLMQDSPLRFVNYSNVDLSISDLYFKGIRYIGPGLRSTWESSEHRTWQNISENRGKLFHW